MKEKRKKNKKYKGWADKRWEKQAGGTTSFFFQLSASFKRQPLLSALHTQTEGKQQAACLGPSDNAVVLQPVRGGGRAVCVGEYFWVREGYVMHPASPNKRRRNPNLNVSMCVSVCVFRLWRCLVRSERCRPGSPHKHIHRSVELAGAQIKHNISFVWFFHSKKWGVVICIEWWWRRTAIQWTWCAVSKFKEFLGCQFLY